MDNNATPMTDATTQPNIGLIKSIATKLSLSSVVSTAKAMLADLGYDTPKAYLDEAAANDGTDGTLAVCDGGCIIDDGDAFCIHGNPSLTAVVTTYDPVADTFTLDGLNIEPAGDIPEAPATVTAAMSDGSVVEVSAPTMEQAVDVAVSLVDQDAANEEIIEVEEDPAVRNVRLALEEAERDEQATAQDLTAAVEFAGQAESTADAACETAANAEEVVDYIRQDLADAQARVDNLSEALDAAEGIPPEFLV